MKKLICSLILALIMWTSLSVSVFAAPVVTLQDIQKRIPGNSVTITGNTDLGNLTVKVLRPNKSILYINVLKGGAFSDSFTLPVDSKVGTYTVIAGSGDVQAVKEFAVIQEDSLSIPVTAIQLAPSNSSMVIGAVTKFTATVLPANATNQAITWSVDGGTGNAQIDKQGLLTAVQLGTVTVKAAATDGSGIVAKVNVTILQSEGANPGGNPTNEVTSAKPVIKDEVIPVKPVIKDEVTPVKPVIKDGVASVQLESNQTAAAVTVRDLQDHSLQVKLGSVIVTVEQSEVQALLKRASNTEDAVLQVKVDPVKNAESESQTQQGGTQLKVVGQIYDVKVSLITKDGSELQAAQLVGGIEISLPYDRNQTDELLLGIYYLNDETKQWEYVGGKVELGTETMKVKLKHLSSYAILEYRKSFDDVAKDHWAARTLEVLAAKHIISGKTDNLYKPDDKTTRAEFTAMLVRVLGLPVSTNSSPFTDVSDHAWYTDTVKAAYAAGLISGITDTQFGPDAAITREQMAILLVKAYEVKQGKISVTQDTLNTFKDQGDISAWAKEAVKKALTAKLMQGIAEGTFDAKSGATRSQNAQAIYNLTKSITP